MLSRSAYLQLLGFFIIGVRFGLLLVVCKVLLEVQLVKVTLCTVLFLYLPPRAVAILVLISKQAFHAAINGL